MLLMAEQIAPIKSLIHTFRHPVDLERQAADVALARIRQNGQVVTVNEVLETWKERDLKQRRLEKELRGYASSVLGGQGSLFAPQAMSGTSGMLKQFDEFWSRQKENFEVIDGFRVLVSPTLKIKGQIDCILEDKETHALSLWQWATGKTLGHYHAYLKKPFSQYPDSQHTRLSLEMSFLQLVFDHTYDIHIDSAHIVLFQEDSYEVAPALNLKEAILESEYGACQKEA